MSPAGAFLLVLGVAGALIGAWTFVNRRRPSWVSRKRLSPGTARMWGAATALSSLGLAILGVDMIGPGSGAIAVLALLLLFGGGAMVTISNFGTRRSR